MINLGINMVWPSGKDNSPHLILFYIIKNLLAFSFDVLPGVCKLVPACACGGPDFVLRYLEFRGKGFDKLACQRFQIGKRHKRVQKTHLSGGDFVYVIFDIFRVRSYNRTVVVVVGIREFISLIWNARIKNKVYVLFNQP